VMTTRDGSEKPSQRATVERLLNDEQVLVHINPNYPGVLIPAYLRDNRTVTLRLSRYFKGRLSTNDEEITAELLFGPNYFVCKIPWGGIWGASSVRGEEYVWHESTPSDILDLVLSQEERNGSLNPRITPLRDDVPRMRIQGAGRRERIKTPRGEITHLRRVK
jgi:hypothetical protein